MKIFRLILVSYFSAFSVFPVPSYGSDESQNLTGHSLSNKQIISELSSDVVDSSHFTVQLVEDMSTFSIDTFGGLGDVSLYVKRGEKPSYDNYDCASLKEGNDENCTLNNVVAGEYHIVLHGDYENTQISALWENNNLMDNTNANEESASNSCEGDDTCVVNYNKIVKLGHLSTAVVPIQWQDSPYFSTARGGPNKLQDWYNRVSRGKVQLKGKNGADKITILKTVKTDLKAACSNRKKAANVARSETNIGHHNIRIYDYAGNVCGYAANANGSARGGNIYVNSSVGNRATTTHEMGHVFKLGHSAVLTTKKGKLTTSSVDRTTPMGSWGAKSYNAPQLHWLDFVEPHEVIKIHPTSKGEKFILRAVLDNQRSGEEPIALVYDIPETGNRLFMSIPKLQNDLVRFRGLNLHTTSPCDKGCSLLRTLKVAAVGEESYYKNGKLHKDTSGIYVDELGLKIEIVEVIDNWDRARVRITKVEKTESDLACTQPVTIDTNFELTRKFNSKTGKAGAGILSMEITNNNAKGCRPIMFFNSGLSVVAEEGRNVKQWKLNKNNGHKGANRGSDYIWSQGDKTNKNHSKFKRSVKLTSANEGTFDITVQAGNLEPVTIPVSFSEKE